MLRLRSVEEETRARYGLLRCGRGVKGSRVALVSWCLPAWSWSSGVAAAVRPRRSPLGRGTSPTGSWLGSPENDLRPRDSASVCNRSVGSYVRTRGQRRDQETVCPPRIVQGHFSRQPITPTSLRWQPSSAGSPESASRMWAWARLPRRSARSRAALHGPPSRSRSPSPFCGRGRVRGVLVVRAITASDNAAAEGLWSRLGSGFEAATATQTVLAEAGDTSTRVNAVRTRPSFTPFGQTSGHWSPRAASWPACHVFPTPPQSSR